MGKMKKLNDPSTSREQLEKMAKRYIVTKKVAKKITEHPNADLAILAHLHPNMSMSMVENAAYRLAGRGGDVEYVQGLLKCEHQTLLVCDHAGYADAVISRLLQNENADVDGVAEEIIKRVKVLIEERSEFVEYMRLSLITAAWAGHEEALHLTLRNIIENRAGQKTLSYLAIRTAVRLIHNATLDRNSIRALLRTGHKEIINALYSKDETPLELGYDITWGAAPTKLRRKVAETLGLSETETYLIEEGKTIGELLKEQTLFDIEELEGRSVDTSDIDPLIESFKNAAKACSLIIDNKLIEVDAATMKQIRETTETVKESVKLAESAWRLGGDPDSEAVRSMVKARLENQVASYRKILSHMIAMAQKQENQEETPLEAEHSIRAWRDIRVGPEMIEA